MHIPSAVRVAGQIPAAAASVLVGLTLAVMLSVGSPGTELEFAL